MARYQIRGKVLISILLFLLLLLTLVTAGLSILVKSAGPRAREPVTPPTTEEQMVAMRLKADVEYLASTLGERNTATIGKLDQAAAFIEQRFRKLGYEVRIQKFDVPFEGMTRQVRNIEAILWGSSEECIVVGAHYDSPLGSPGADDNASGVAGLLEMARALERNHGKRAVRFVAFVNEEPPYFRTAFMGSYVYAMDLAEVRRANVACMISLECLGLYSDERGSQTFPFPMGFFYSHRGDFLSFVSNFASSDVMKKGVMAFRAATDLPAEGARAPEVLPGIGWSDHWAFWEAGYPAFMVTDTALFRNRHYHQPGDTPEMLDYGRMAKSVTGMNAVLRSLLGE